MQHSYPRAISLALRGAVDLHGLISHRMPLERAPEAFALNVAYREQVVKIMIDI